MRVCARLCVHACVCACVYAFLRVCACLYACLRCSYSMRLSLRVCASMHVYARVLPLSLLPDQPSDHPSFIGSYLVLFFYVLLKWFNIRVRAFGYAVCTVILRFSYFFVCVSFVCVLFVSCNVGVLFVRFLCCGNNVFQMWLWVGACVFLSVFLLVQELVAYQSGVLLTSPPPPVFFLQRGRGCCRAVLCRAVS